MGVIAIVPSFVGVAQLSVAADWANGLNPAFVAPQISACRGFLPYPLKSGKSDRYITLLMVKIWCAVGILTDSEFLWVG